MTQVALSDFAENVYEYLNNLDSEGITLIKDGKRVAVVAIPKDYAQELRDLVGPINLPDNFDFKKVEQERLRKKYENLD